MYNLNLASPKSARGSQICPDKGTTQDSIEMISHQIGFIPSGSLKGIRTALSLAARRAPRAATEHAMKSVMLRPIFLWIGEASAA